MPTMGPKTMTVLVIIAVVAAVSALGAGVAANVRLGGFQAGAQLGTK